MPRVSANLPPDMLCSRPHPSADSACCQPIPFNVDLDLHIQADQVCFQVGYPLEVALESEIVYVPASALTPR